MDAPDPYDQDLGRNSGGGLIPLAALFESLAADERTLCPFSCGFFGTQQSSNWGRGAGGDLPLVATATWPWGELNQSKKRDTCIIYHCQVDDPTQTARSQPQ